MTHVPFQIIITACFGLIILFVISSVRAKRMNRHRSAAWITFWITGLFVVWFPDSTSQFARLLGVSRGVDVVLYLSIVLLAYLIFQLYMALEAQDQVITQLVSEIALRSEEDAEMGDKGLV